MGPCMIESLIRCKPLWKERGSFDSSILSKFGWLVVSISVMFSLSCDCNSCCKILLLHIKVVVWCTLYLFILYMQFMLMLIYTEMHCTCKFHVDATIYLSRWTSPEYSTCAYHSISHSRISKDSGSKFKPNQQTHISDIRLCLCTWASELKSI